MEIEIIRKIINIPVLDEWLVVIVSHAAGDLDVAGKLSLNLVE